MSETMHGYVLRNLNAWKGRWAEVARATGVSRRTIEKISSGVIADPKVSKLEVLAGFFRTNEHEQSAENP